MTKQQKNALVDAVIGAIQEAASSVGTVEELGELNDKISDLLATIDAYETDEE